jgi:hypothetical protein
MMKNIKPTRTLFFFLAVTAVLKSSGQQETIPTDSIEHLHICGDLHQFRHDNQEQYKRFKLGLSSSVKSTGSLESEATFSCGSFTIYYEDFLEPNPGGFADPIEGASRRQTFCDVLAYVESVIDFDSDANPVIHVLPSYYENGNPAPSNTRFLARASAVYDTDYGDIQGVYTGYIAQQIQLGVDPDPSAAIDGWLQVNFHETMGSNPLTYFYSGDPISNDYKFDLFLVLLHEVSHMLGFASALEEGENGEVACENDADSYLIWDYQFGYFGDITNPSTFTG